MSDPLNGGSAAAETILRVVSPTEPMTWQRAVHAIERHTLDREEFEQLVRMVAPASYRCAVCDRVFVVPSLARQCEQKHEEERNV